MNLSTEFIQLENGQAFFNCRVVQEALTVTGYVTDHMVHLIAWDARGGSTFTLLQMSSARYEEWLKTERDKYSKVLVIARGGVDNLAVTTPSMMERHDAMLLSATGGQIWCGGVRVQ